MKLKDLVGLGIVVAGIGVIIAGMNYVEDNLNPRVDTSTGEEVVPNVLDNIKED